MLTMKRSRLATKIATEMNANPRHGVVGCVMAGNLTR